MTKQPIVETALRIPGRWKDPTELLDRLPEGFRFESDDLVMPDGTAIGCFPVAPDEQFADIFQTSCRRPATQDEVDTIQHYSANVCLYGPGGSFESAQAMMTAGSAIIQAGGAGVFIDNSALAHGGQDWLEMAEADDPDAISFAFVSIIASRYEIRTLGMQVLGMPEIVMTRTTDDETDSAIIEVIRYMCHSEKPIGDGHVLCDLTGPTYSTKAITDDEFETESPMHNPWGRLRLISAGDIAQNN